MSLTYTIATPQDLPGILSLQRENLAVNLSSAEVREQGFVTVVHTLTSLGNMNDIEPHIIAKDGDTVAAYLLAMTAAAQNDIEVLKPMFELFEHIQLHGKPIASYKYIVVGQVCVGKPYRGQGVLDAAYAEYRRRLSGKYDFAITEISTRNTRSLRGHERVGFREVHRFTAPDGEEWSVVAWEW